MSEAAERAERIRKFRASIEYELVDHRQPGTIYSYMKNVKEQLGEAEKQLAEAEGRVYSHVDDDDDDDDNDYDGLNPADKFKRYAEKIKSKHLNKGRTLVSLEDKYDELKARCISIGGRGYIMTDSEAEDDDCDEEDEDEDEDEGEGKDEDEDEDEDEDDDCEGVNVCCLVKDYADIYYKKKKNGKFKKIIAGGGGETCYSNGITEGDGNVFEGIEQAPQGNPECKKDGEDRRVEME